MTGSGPEPGATLRIYELLDMLRHAETSLLNALGAGRGVDRELTAATAVVLSADELRDLRSASLDLAERADQVRLVAEGLTAAECEVRLNTLRIEAGAALSAGVADVERVERLAACLPARTGYQALAAMLRCTDLHQAWNETTLSDLLGLFHNVDPRALRAISDLATVSPDPALGRMRSRHDHSHRVGSRTLRCRASPVDRRTVSSAAHESNADRTPATRSSAAFATVSTRDCCIGSTTSSSQRSQQTTRPPPALAGQHDVRFRTARRSPHSPGTRASDPSENPAGRLQRHGRINQRRGTVAGMGDAGAQRRLPRQDATQTWGAQIGGARCEARRNRTPLRCPD